MPGPTPRQRVLIEKRRQEVSALYLRGTSQYAIAQMLGLTQPQISIDLKAVRAQWLQSSLRDFDEAKSIELAKIDQVEIAAWQGWERSLHPREITVTEGTEGGDKTTRKASVRREGQAGDPRFLEQVHKCIAQRCAILGLHAPKRFQVGWDSLSDAQLERLAAGENPMAVLAEA